MKTAQDIISDFLAAFESMMPKYLADQYAMELIARLRDHGYYIAVREHMGAD